MNTAITNTTDSMLPADIERVLVSGDLSKLTSEQRISYVNATCKSLGLNPLTRPFEYVTLNGKLQLYAKRDAADQLRKINGVSIEQLGHRIIEGVLMVTANAKDATGRTDQATGAVNINGLKGEALANAYMKAETKAKRRVTLSICGLGFLTEDELDDAERDQRGNANFPRQTSSQFDLESKPFDKPAQKPAETPAPAEKQAPTPAAVVEAEVVEALPVPESVAPWIRGKWKDRMGDIKTKALAEARSAALEGDNPDDAYPALASIYDETMARIAAKGMSESDFADMVCANGIEGIEFPADLWTKLPKYQAILNIAKALK